MMIYPVRGRGTNDGNIAMPKLPRFLTLFSPMKLWLTVWLCLFSTSGLAQAADLAGIHVIKNVEFAASNSNQPPVLSADQWQKIILPDIWQSNHPDYGGNIWYRSMLQVRELPDSLWGIYLPRLSMNAAVYVNGVMVGTGGRFTQPMARNWNRPLYFTVPQSLWHRGENMIMVRVQADKNCRGALHAMQVGPDAQLCPDFKRAMKIQIDALKVLFVLSLCVSAITFALWLLRRRKDAMYGWYALGTFFWGIYIQYFFVQDISVSAHTWMWLTFSSGYGMIISMMLFTQLFIRLQCNWSLKLMPIYGLLASALLYASSMDSIMDLIALSFAGILLFSLFIMSHLARYIYQHRNLESALLCFGIMANIGFGVHDILMLKLVWSPNVYLLNYGTPLLFLAMGMILVNRFLSVLKESERLNLELDERVQQREDELLVAHEQLRAIERKKAVLKERERMVEDLHDGMGGQLAAALTLVDKPDDEGLLKQALEGAMLDFRLVIDSMDEESRDIATLLGMLRMRLEPQLQAADIELHWRYEGAIDAPEMTAVGSEVSLHILRIVQEAISNAIRHASADAIEVAVITGDGALNIRVHDNGVGMDKGTHHGGGHGIGHMYKRAARVGVQLDISSSDQGVEVCLSYRPEQVVE